jgi:hypothetical protein
MSEWESFTSHVRALDRWNYIRAVIGGHIMGKQATALGVEYFKMRAETEAEGEFDCEGFCINDPRCVTQCVPYEEEA